MRRAPEPERWEVICRGHYAISSFGRVMRTTAAPGTYPGRILARRRGGDYLEFRASIKGKVVSLSVHRLVAQAFIGRCPRNKEVNHKDGNKLNPRASNLEYLTHRENIIHAYARRARRKRKEGSAQCQRSSKTTNSKNYSRRSTVKNVRG